MRLAIVWLVMRSAVAHAGRPADEVKKLVDQQLAVCSRARAEANLSSDGLYFNGARFTVTATPPARTTPRSTPAIRRSMSSQHNESGRAHIYSKWPDVRC
jgi:hypothetical protein